MITRVSRQHLALAGRLARIAVIGTLAVADYGLGLPATSSDVGLIAALAMILLIVAVTVVVGRSYPRNSQRLPVHTLVIAVSSLGVTLLTLLSAGPESRPKTLGLAEAAGMLVLIVRVARRGMPDLSVAAVTVGALAIAVQPVRIGGPHDAVVVPGLVLGLCAAAAASVGIYLRMLDANRDHQLATAQAEQRLAFARDLHDFVAHHITGMVVQAQGARMIAEQDQRVLAALERIERAGVEAMTSMHHMVGALRTAETRQDVPGAPVATAADIAPLVADFATAGGAVAELHVEGALDDLPAEVGLSAHRVVIEALTNIRRHAPRSGRVQVWLERTPAWLLVRVVNDGPPPRTEILREREGFGLAGLAERIGMVGGRIKAGPGIDGGWIVEAAIPLRGEVTP
jgi:signal transduction histidine kinase